MLALMNPAAFVIELMPAPQLKEARPPKRGKYRCAVGGLLPLTVSTVAKGAFLLVDFLAMRIIELRRLGPVGIAPGPGMSAPVGAPVGKEVRVTFQRNENLAI